MKQLGNSSSFHRQLIIRSMVRANWRSPMRIAIAFSGHGLGRFEIVDTDTLMNVGGWAERFQR